MLGLILTLIHVYIIFSNAQSGKTFLKIAVLIKLQQITCIVELQKELTAPCINFVRVLFGLYWVFFQVLGIIHLNMLSPIHVRNVRHFEEFLLYQFWVYSVLTVYISISEIYNMYSLNLWYFSYHLTKKSPENSDSNYVKLRFNPSKDYWIGPYFWTHRGSKGEFFALHGEVLLKFAL